MKIQPNIVDYTIRNISRYVSDLNNNAKTDRKNLPPFLPGSRYYYRDCHNINLLILKSENALKFILLKIYLILEIDRNSKWY
ncbi:unnamed protein product [Rhizophagus irregularis]|uniref:Uncharacterized protein n=1 Tax=Rhizophagus irregularis TaxID=588596 RepID=A0A915YVH8_9GLOM|nr:unnamed protein product [Rhizophagus irregularis]CAB5347317.1 unnamed protein product [Rhizophagus irregularis]